MKSSEDRDKSKKVNSQNSIISLKVIFDKATKLHSSGNIPEAIKNYNFLLNNNFNDPRLFANYGNILKDLGKLKEAELSFRKAIELKPDFIDVYFIATRFKKVFRECKQGITCRVQCR